MDRSPHGFPCQCRLETIGCAETDINLWDNISKIRVVTDWRVSIEPASLNKLAKILRCSLRITGKHGEYISLMQFLTRSGINLLDFVDMGDGKIVGKSRKRFIAGACRRCISDRVYRFWKLVFLCNLVNAIQMGICNDATKKRMDELEARKAEIEVQIAKEEIAKPKLTRDQVCCYLHHFRTFDTNNFEHRRRFIDTFINRIFLYDDKIVITFNYQNGTKTVTFAELEASGILSELVTNGEPKNPECESVQDFYFTITFSLFT